MVLPWDDEPYTALPTSFIVLWLPALIKDNLNWRIYQIKRRMYNADEHLRLVQQQCKVPLDDEDWESFHWRIIKDLIGSARDWLHND